MTRTVFIIAIEPKSKLQTAFVGTVLILDGEFAMIAVDLKPSEAVRFPPPLSGFSFAVQQQFSNFDEDFWLPVDVSVSAIIKIKLPGLEFPAINYRQLTRFSDYEVNVALPDSLYNVKKGTVTVAVSNEGVSTTIEERSTEMPRKSPRILRPIQPTGKTGSGTEHDFR